MNNSDLSVNQKPNLLKNSINIFITRVIIFAISIFSGIIIARSLGPSGKGILALLIFIPTLMLRLGNLGFGAALIYFTGKKKYDLKQLTTNSIIIAVILGAVLIILFYIFFGQIYQLFFQKSAVNPIFLKLVILIVPFLLIQFYLSHNLLIQNKIRKYNYIEFLAVLTNLVFLIVFIILLKQQIFGALISFFASILVPFIIIIFFTWDTIDKKFHFSMLAFWDSLIYGIKNFFTTISDFINNRVDILMMGYFLVASQIGIYSVAVGIGELMWYIPNSISTVLFPRVSSIDKDYANKLSAKICRVSFFIILFIAIFIIFTAKMIIKLLYGKIFIPAINPLLILIPGIVILSITKILTSDVAGRGKPGVVAIISIITAAINVVLNLFFIPLWNINGAALASTISYTFSGLTMLILFMKLSNNNLYNVIIIKKTDILELFQVAKKIIKRNQPA